jgi:predicted transcriptional regulator
MNEQQFNELKKDLEAVKKLLALGLIKQGVDTTSIGKALGVSQGRVSQVLGQKRTKIKNSLKEG